MVDANTPRAYGWFRAARSTYRRAKEDGHDKKRDFDEALTVNTGRRARANSAASQSQGVEAQNI